MQVHQVMSHPVDVISPTTPSSEAAVLMRDENIGSLPVGDNGKLIGMVTDRDIVTRVVAENSAPSNTAVGTVMSQGLYYCLRTIASWRPPRSWRNIRYVACPF